MSSSLEENGGFGWYYYYYYYYYWGGAWGGRLRGLLGEAWGRLGKPGGSLG